MLDISELTICRGGRELFSPISFNVKPNSVTVIMGASGIGKSSILDAIRGLIPYDGVISAPSHFSIFQDTNQLFPWYTMRKNLDLVCSSDYISTAKTWGVQDLLDKKPNSVSGGQKQRYTLLRALHSGRQLLLCDEATSALDALTKYSVLLDFKRSIINSNLCCLWMTHDLTEAKLLGDTIYLLTSNGLQTITQTTSEGELLEKLQK